MLEKLINECKKNNTQAQEQLYKLLAPKLFAVCLKYSRNYEEAQDHLQESFLIILIKLYSLIIKDLLKVGQKELW